MHFSQSFAPEVKDQYFSRFATRKSQLGLTIKQCAVAAIENMTIQGNLATRKMHIGQPAGIKLPVHLLTIVEESRFNASVRIDAHRPIGSVRRHDQTQAALALGR